MSNELKMAIVQSIQQLLAAGWSQRRIARQLGIDRSAVKRHVDLLRNATTATSKPATAPTGSPGSKPATFDAVPGTAGSEPGVAGFEPCEAPTGLAPESNEPLSVGHRDTGESTGANVTTGPAETPCSPADRSACEAHRAAIQAKVDQGLSAIRIHRDLHDEWGVTLSYYRVRRFVRKLSGTQPLPFRRLECGPSEEAQVDFGSGAPVVTAEGKRRKVSVFRIVLSHSRKAYSEATFTQTTEDFLRCLENAFAHFGGVPRTLVIDN